MTLATGATSRGRLELGQTHIVDAINEHRIHSRMVVERETLLLYTPEVPLPGPPNVLVAMLDPDSALLGILRMLPCVAVSRQPCMLISAASS
jgi:hypothetical protein